MDRRVRTTGAALLLVVGLFAALGSTTPHAAAATGCPDLPGLTPNVWLGTDDGFWRDDDNWSLGYAPGYVDGAIGYACILSGTARLADTDVRKVIALYVGDGASLVVDTGSKLFIRGNPDNQPSTVAKGGNLIVDGATFGGEGRLRMAGTLEWHSEPGGPPATLATRECAVEPPPVEGGEQCGSARGGHLDGPGGLLVVKTSGVVQVDGVGVDLVDSYRLRVFGTVAVTGEGYVVADRGTSTELRRTGVFRFDNDGGYYEGEARFGETQLSSFLNDGHLDKTGGVGVSAVNAFYTQPVGKIRIEQGTLRVASGAPVAARVGPGATYGSGGCRKVGGSFGCRPRTDASDVQNAALRVPKIDGHGADVVVSELPPSESVFSLGTPVEVHAENLDATKRHPAILSFRYDDTLLAPAQGWQNIRVLRDSEGPGGYRHVQACDQDGRPPEGEQACVDRRNIPGVSSRNKRGDVIMVVRAVGTSRWICR